MGFNSGFKGLKAELNPICYLLALLGARHILHVSGLRVKFSTSVHFTLKLPEFLNKDGVQKFVMWYKYRS